MGGVHSFVVVSVLYINFFGSEGGRFERDGFCQSWGVCVWWGGGGAGVQYSNNNNRTMSQLLLIDPAVST